MPTAFHVGPYRLFIYSSDRDEPPHVHVERERFVAKFWLDPVRLVRSGGFRRAEVVKIQSLVISHEADLLEKWHDYFRS